MLRARRSASRRASSSTWRISRALSWRSSSSSSRSMICFAWPALRPGEPLQLAQLVALGGLQLLARVLAGCAGGRRARARARSSSCACELDRALLGAQALLEPGQLGAAHLQLVLELVACAPWARRPAPPRARRRPARTGAAVGRLRGARALHQRARPTRRPPPPPAPPTRSPFGVSLCPGAARAGLVGFERLARRRETPARPPKAARAPG